MGGEQAVLQRMGEHLANNKYKKKYVKKTTPNAKKQQKTLNPIQTKRNNKTKPNGLLTVNYHIMNEQHIIHQKYSKERNLQQRIS